MELNTNRSHSIEWVGDSTNVTVAAANDPWFAPAKLKLRGWSVGFGTVGTGTVTVKLYVDGVEIDSIDTTVEYSGMQALSNVLDVGDKVQVAITAAGTGYQNIVAQVLYEV